MGRTKMTARKTIQRDNQEEQQPSSKRAKREDNENQFSPLLGSSCLMYHKESHKLFVQRKDDKSIHQLEAQFPLLMSDVVAVYDMHEFHGVLTQSRVLFFFDDEDQQQDKTYSIALAEPIPDGFRVDSFRADFDDDRDFGFAYRFTDYESKVADEADRRSTMAVNMFYSNFSHLEPKLEHVLVDLNLERELVAVQVEQGVLVVVLQNSQTRVHEFMLFNPDNILQGVVGFQRNDNQKVPDFDFTIHAVKDASGINLESARITSVVASVEIEF
jgi:hypothetical protein